MGGLTLEEQARRSQRIWDLFYVDQMSYAAIARELGMSRQGVYSFMTRRGWPTDHNTPPDERPTRPVL